MRNNKVRKRNGRAVEANAPSAEKDFDNSIKAATEVPRSSFEFYVWSDEGVNLTVDLTSSPLDWTNRFRNEVRISENLHGNKSRSLRQDISILREKSSSGLKLTKDGVAGLDQQNNGDRPFISYSLTPCSTTVKVAENLQENQSTVSAEVSYGAPNKFISGAESCAKDKPKGILASDAIKTTFNKSLCDSVDNKLELQHSKSDNECSEDCGLPNGSCIVNPGVIDGNDFPLQNEEWEAAKIVDGRERSGCSQFDDPHKESSLDSGDQVSKTELCKKRKNGHSEIQGSSVKPTRILRSMTKTRRSPRLISKVALFIWKIYNIYTQ